jgi:hypothetical protein
MLVLVQDTGKEECAFGYQNMYQRLSENCHLGIYLYAVTNASHGTEITHFINVTHRKNKDIVTIIDHVKIGNFYCKEFFFVSLTKQQ